MLLVFEQIEWRTFWDEKESAEFKLTFNREVLNSQMIFPIVGQALVEFSVLFVGDIVWVTGPDWFGLETSFIIYEIMIYYNKYLVKLLEFGVLFFFDHLLFGVLFLVTFLDFFNLWLV